MSLTALWKSAVSSSLLPCYAWIIISHNVLREQGISMDGCCATTMNKKKQMRFYDAVVIPQRSSAVMFMNEEMEQELIQKCFEKVLDYLKNEKDRY